MIKILSNDSKGGTDFEPVFEDLNDELLKANQTLKLVCAGGYVMQLQGYNRC